MTVLFLFLYLLAVHAIADFSLQTHWQASNKSKNLEALGRHVLTYTVCLAVAAPVLAPPSAKLAGFVLVNGALHFATDFFTSKASAYFYRRQDWHNFFVIIGFDQLIHQTTLALTLWSLLR